MPGTDGPVSSRPGPMGTEGHLPAGCAEVQEGAVAEEGGIQQVRAGLLCRSWALSRVAGVPRAGRRARPKRWPLPGGPANDPAHIPACISGELAEGRPISWNSPNAHTSEWRGGEVKS